MGWVADRGLAPVPRARRRRCWCGAGLARVVEHAHRLGQEPGRDRRATSPPGPGRRRFWTAPIKALVSEKFFDLSATFPFRPCSPATPRPPSSGGDPQNLALRARRLGQVRDRFQLFADPDGAAARTVTLSRSSQPRWATFSLHRRPPGAHRRHGLGRPSRSRSSPVPLTEVLEELLATAYVVRFTQGVAAIGNFSSAGLGKTLSRFVRHGVGVPPRGHVAQVPVIAPGPGRAPRGHLQPTRSASDQRPIRTVVFTLCHCDGTDTRCRPASSTRSAPILKLCSPASLVSVPLTPCE